MLRLAPHLHLAAENALTADQPDVVIGRLADIASGGAAPVDGLRLLALAARQRGDDEHARRILEAARDIAATGGDLIGAVDALRRLDAMGENTTDSWTQFLDHVASLGFGEAPTRQEWIDCSDDGPDADAEAVCERAATCAPSSGSGVLARPFSPVPLLSDIPIAELRSVLRSLQLRIVPDGEPLSSAGGGAPAWVASGAVSADGTSATVRVGTLVVPGEDSAKAHGTVRLLTLPRELWEMLEETEAVATALSSALRSARLAGALRISPLYRRMSPSFREWFVDALTCATVRDERLITKGERVRGLFLVVHGAVVVVDDSEPDPIEIARLEPGDVFGELDVLTAGGAEFHVDARGDVEVCFVPADDARTLLVEEPNARRYLVELTESRHAPKPDPDDQASEDVSA